MRFEYEARTACICGETLEGASQIITNTLVQGTVRFVRCERCGSWCQSPQITQSSLALWFDSPDYQGRGSTPGRIYYDYLADEESRLHEAEGRYERDLKRDLVPGARVLELGCATGSLLSVLRRHGHDVVGVDLSARFVEAARKLYGLHVISGDLLDVTLPHERFDAIILFGTMGNLQRLHTYLLRFRELLAPAGILLFNFADAGSFTARHVYRSRFWMFTPSVNSFMSGDGCRIAMERAGFTIQTMRTDHQQPSLQKLLNHSGLRWGVPILKRLGMAGVILPVPLPIPSIRLVKATCAG